MLFLYEVMRRAGQEGGDTVSTLPSSNSSAAPPPVEMKDMLSETPARWTASAVSAPPTMVTRISVRNGVARHGATRIGFHLENAHGPFRDGLGIAEAS